MEKITFIGLGVMGFPMAGHLAKEGYNVFTIGQKKNQNCGLKTISEPIPLQ